MLVLQVYFFNCVKYAVRQNALEHCQLRECQRQEFLSFRMGPNKISLCFYMERYDILQVKNAMVMSVYYIIQCTIRSMMSNFVFMYYKKKLVWHRNH